MKVEVLQNKPGTAYSVSYNMAPFMQAQFGIEPEEELFGTITLIGLSAKPGRTLPTGVLELEYQDQLLEILASEDVAKIVSLYTFSLNEAFSSTAAAFNPTTVYNPCDYLLAFNLAELCLTQLPSNAPAVNAAPVGAGSSSSSSNICLGSSQSLGSDAYDSVLIGNWVSQYSRDSITIGYEVSTGSDSWESVNIGHQTSCQGTHTICIGADACTYGNRAIAIGSGNDYDRLQTNTFFSCYTYARGDSSVAIGVNTHVRANNSVALGNDIHVADKDVTVLGGRPLGSNNKTTRFYILPEGSALAEKYENGKAALAYAVTDDDNNLIESGTRKLAELLTNNSTFTPAVMSLDDEEQPTVFIPTIEEGDVQRIERKKEEPSTDPKSAITAMFNKDKRNVADPQAVIKKLFGAFKLA